MDISVFGLGYVGCVSAACLAADGHRVIGVDINKTKVDEISSGQCPIVEPGLPELIEQNSRSGRLQATDRADEAVMATDLSIVCIQTPSSPNGSLDLKYVIRVAEQIGDVLRRKNSFHVVAFRSTMLPGTMDRTMIPTLVKHSGKTVGEGFGAAFHPEFLREGSAVADFRSPPRTVIGATEDRTRDVLTSLYTDVDAPLVVTDLRTAELVKYADNAFHALKVAFANEIGAICREAGVNSHEAMRIFCLDSKLNLSPVYLRPGFAFGGSCLPKDLRALTYLAKSLDVQVPVLDATLLSNAAHKRRALDLVMAQGKRPIGVLGLSFKSGTDDLRESPTVELVEQLIGKGYEVKIYDPDVALSRLTGSNKAYIDRELPHVASLLVGDIRSLVDRSQTLIMTKKTREFEDALKQLRPEQTVVDLVRIYGESLTAAAQYHALVG
ncbi:MAG: UDP-glucose/GDP-mannose dehydrogenase family protein [Steroidobacteraceae bacterium]